MTLFFLSLSRAEGCLANYFTTDGWPCRSTVLRGYSDHDMIMGHSMSSTFKLNYQCKAMEPHMHLQATAWVSNMRKSEIPAGTTRPCVPSSYLIRACRWSRLNHDSTCIEALHVRASHIIHAVLSCSFSRSLQYSNSYFYCLSLQVQHGETALSIDRAALGMRGCFA